MATKTKEKYDNKELAMVRMCELGDSYTDLCNDLLGMEDQLDPMYTELLHRAKALVSRIVAVTDAENRHQFDKNVAAKLMLLEIQSMLEDADKSTPGVIKKDVAKALNDSVTAALGTLDHVAI